MRFVMMLLKARTAQAGILPDKKLAGAGRRNENLRTCWACYSGSSRGCARSPFCSPAE
jgi:hypothetical protein